MCVFVYYFTAGNGGAIFYNDHFKMSVLLVAQTTQQFVYFLWPIVYGHDH